MRAQRSLKKRKIGIATQVFIGLGLGLLVGVFFGEDAAFLNPTSTVLRKMVGEIRGIARGATGRTVMWC